MGLLCAVFPNGNVQWEILYIFLFGKMYAHMRDIFPFGKMFRSTTPSVGRRGVWRRAMSEGEPPVFAVPRKPRNTDGKLRNAADLGAAIRNRRRELGLTQVQVAEGCRCSP